MEFLALAMAAVLAVVHLFAGKMRFLDVIPRSRWLSFGSGISVAYVFAHLLPELAERQREHETVTLLGGVRGDIWVWLAALAGLTVFYGLERAAKRTTHAHQETDDGLEPASLFALHISSYALYNALVGYLLVRRPEEGLLALAAYSLAMALHFLVNDYGLRQDHRERYRRTGRWWLAAAVLGGCLAGFAIELPGEAITVMLALLGGGVILNVLKEELPEERQSRFTAFAAGAALYAALLVAI